MNEKDEIQDCPLCGGDGYIEKHDYLTNSDREVVCDMCDGLGFIVEE